MGFLKGFPGTRTVTLIKGEGTGAAQRVEIEGQIQAQKGFFSLQVPIQEGDVIEEADPRPGMSAIRRTVGRVDLYQGYGDMSHIEVTWGQPPKAARLAPAVLAIGDLHERVIQAAGALYEDGHAAQAVFEAFKAVEVRIRDISAVDETGTRLIGQVFGGKPPARRLTKRAGRLGEDEHEGWRLMLLGASQGVRNLGAHELEGIEPASAVELLALASQFMRWLDET
jgi:uncharacterized protein (TIGR02391 family)